MNIRFQTISPAHPVDSFQYNLESCIFHTNMERCWLDKLHHNHREYSDYLIQPVLLKRDIKRLEFEQSQIKQQIDFHSIAFQKYAIALAINVMDEKKVTITEEP
jgi:hypothetical protein